MSAVIARKVYRKSQTQLLLELGVERWTLDVEPRAAAHQMRDAAPQSSGACGGLNVQLPTLNVQRPKVGPTFPAMSQNAFPRLRHFLLGLAALVCLPLCSRAALQVDWLSFSAGADRNHFSLLDDQGVAVAQAEVQLVLGLFAPLSPSPGLLQAPFWMTPPDFTDSVLGDASVKTVKLQVAPQSGAVQYRLTLTGADLSGMNFAIGQLFATAAAGTRSVEISARTATATAVPGNLLSTNGWDDGTRSYTQSVTWDAAQQIVSPAANANGESVLAFFNIPSGGSPVTQLSFNIPNGYNTGSGDAIEFAFGVNPVPEPAASVLIIAGVGFMAGRSRRRMRG